MVWYGMVLSVKQNKAAKVARDLAGTWRYVGKITSGFGDSSRKELSINGLRMHMLHHILGIMRRSLLEGMLHA